MPLRRSQRLWAGQLVAQMERDTGDSENTEGPD
jgi:hypothetical protein